MGKTVTFRIKEGQEDKFYNLLFESIMQEQKGEQSVLYEFLSLVEIDKSRLQAFSNLSEKDSSSLKCLVNAYENMEKNCSTRINQYRRLLGDNFNAFQTSELGESLKQQVVMHFFRETFDGKEDSLEYKMALSNLSKGFVELVEGLVKGIGSSMGTTIGKIVAIQQLVFGFYEQMAAGTTNLSSEQLTKIDIYSSHDDQLQRITDIDLINNPPETFYSIEEDLLVYKSTVDSNLTLVYYPLFFENISEIKLSSLEPTLTILIPKEILDIIEEIATNYSSLQQDEFFKHATNLGLDLSQITIHDQEQKQATGTTDSIFENDESQHQIQEIGRNYFTLQSEDIKSQSYKDLLVASLLGSVKKEHPELSNYIAHVFVGHIAAELRILERITHVKIKGGYIKYLDNSVRNMAKRATKILSSASFAD